MRGRCAAPVPSSKVVQRQQHCRQAFSSPPKTFLFMHAHSQTPLPQQPQPTGPGSTTASKTRPYPPICAKIYNAHALKAIVLVCYISNGIPKSTRMILKGQHGLVFEKKQVYFSKAEFFLWNMRWYDSKNTKWFVSILISCWLENKKISHHLIPSPRSLERVLNLWSYKKGKKTHMHSSSDISTSFSETDKHSRMLLHFLSSLGWVGTRK